MKDTPEKKCALAFIDAVNRHDVSAVLHLMTEDHVFADSAGREIVGKKRLRDPWAQYFAMFPDYKVTVEQILQEADKVAVFGLAQGTFAVNGEKMPNGHWEVPAAWKVKVDEGKVARWQVYADTSPVRRIIEAASEF